MFVPISVATSLIFISGVAACSVDAIITAPGTNARRILAGATEAIFDAYILEGRIESSDKYAFTFNAAYTTKMADGDATGNCMIASFFSDYKYYYINSTQCKWTGPVNNMDDYKKLTYETIIASPVESKEETISCLLQMKNSSGNTVRKDEIVRNDFFHGVIPISLKTD